MLKKLFSRDKLIGYGDRLVKLLVDYLVTLIFAYIAVFSVCGAIPHVAETYTPELLLRYTAFFAAVWNILLSSAAISILTITALFASAVASVIYYIADPTFQAFIDSYFRWISTLFWKINAADALFEYVTVIAITVFFTLLLTFFATRFSNVWLVLFLIVPFAAYYDMLVALRAGSVDATCMPRTVALSHRDKAMVLSGYALGTVDYHVIGTREEKDLLSLIDSQLLKWANDGTLRKWYEAYDLLYDLG